MTLGFIITSFVTLFVIIEPIGITPLFIALTRGMSVQKRRRIGVHACLVAIGLLTTFGLTLVRDLTTGIVAGCAVAAVLVVFKAPVAEEGA